MRHIQLFSIIFLLFFGFSVCAQTDPIAEKEKKEGKKEEDPYKAKPNTNVDPTQTPADWRKNLLFGGNFWLSFGNPTFVDISPVVAYRLSDRMQIGTGIAFQYSKRTYYTVGGNYGMESSIYGGRVFARYFPMPTFFGHAEYETVSIKYYDQLYLGGEYRRDWVPGFLVGGGYNTPLGGRAGIQMTILYNLLWNELRSPTSSPWVIRMGFMF
jgi:hypothetical protein